MEKPFLKSMIPYHRFVIKTCNICRKALPLDKFYKNSTSKDGYQHRCKDCQREEMRKWRKDNPDKQSDIAKRYRESEKGQESRQAYRDTKKAQSRNGKLLSRYGITQEQYEEMYEAQQGICPICCGWFEKLFVDHCHDTGKVRALLCGMCNPGLGFFKDDVELLKRAIEYLDGWRSRF
jgi:hypothetical protein